MDEQYRWPLASVTRMDATESSDQEQFGIDGSAGNAGQRTSYFQDQREDDPMCRNRTALRVTRVRRPTRQIKTASCALQGLASRQEGVF